MRRLTQIIQSYYYHRSPTARVMRPIATDVAGTFPAAGLAWGTSNGLEWGSGNILRWS